jgi:hypothetical protein
VVFEVGFTGDPSSLRDERVVAIPLTRAIGYYARAIKKIPADANISAEAYILDIGERPDSQASKGYQCDY